MSCSPDGLIESVRAAAGQMEGEGVAFFDDATDPFEEANTMAADLGLTACAGS